ncbi:hypothetical protein BWI93_25030 [Siphonobacter sp. BAB-5385]|uniref:hypothetical protein n=1 Tax=Siphonobacter sp. BAB-5385 TaxID=1864822 RepID=UPI000B9E8323|nr:hypothetical protein [Siphonobacter sp. BAB-5385]OZI05532.1 hypothetical protein BWI93_25030 [Siphonobacter sp. BAB-5385]
MANKLDDILKNMAPEKRAELENTRVELKNQNVALTPSNYDPQAPPRRASEIDTSEPKLNPGLAPKETPNAVDRVVASSQHTTEQNSQRKKEQGLER